MNNNKGNLLIFLLDNSNNIKHEINIIKPKNYQQLLSKIIKGFKGLPGNFYIFYHNEKNEEIRVDNDKQ